MSTSTIRTTYTPGEAVLREAAASRARMLEERRVRVDDFVERNGDEFQERFGPAGQEMCELTGRFQEMADLAPGDLREELEELFDGGAEVGELSERVETLEREAADRFENREICHRGLADIARSANGVAENLTWEPGGQLASLYHFPEGGQMGAEISERSLGDGVTREVAWLGRTSDVRDCEVHENLVRGVVDKVDGMEMGDSPVPGERGADGGQAGREAAGEAG